MTGWMDYLFVGGGLKVTVQWLASPDVPRVGETCDFFIPDLMTSFILFI